MKKLLSFLLSLIMAISILGCSTQEDIEEKDQIISEYEAQILEYEETISDYESQIEDLEVTVDELYDEQSFLYDEIERYESFTGNKGGFVFYTKTGSKYHQNWCSYLSDPCFMMLKQDAIDSGYTPCSRCYP